ncbi:lamin tail domain-containing protein [uncultured Thiothrix sp.]|uniref:lamin tail domain-containing protein n=1 Tax=uncultured Thiothrix sp. TaxID=223185 RepID=UPI0026068F1C|nr:lamin tail domain-containing protein [uncultured Thiothrix sp.]
MAANNKNKHSPLKTLVLCLESWLFVLLLFLFSSPSYAITYPISALRSQLVINEVLYKQSGANTLAENDEFIELYNAGAAAIDLTRLRLLDGNLFTNEIDGTAGNITGNTSAFTFSCTTTQTCSGASLLPAKSYAVIWIGQQSAKTSAPYASFQAWLRNVPKLNDTGDDVWLYEQTSTGLSLVDYVSVGSGTAVNTNVPSTIWDFTYNTALANFTKGQSLSLSPNGQSSTGACWEPTTSGLASTHCPNYLPTLDTDSSSTRISSQGNANTTLHFISGRVFQDLNVNSLDDSESGLGKVNVVLYHLANHACETRQTDASGAYRFTGLVNGDYVVYEAAQGVGASNACPPVASDPNQYHSTSSNQVALTLANQSVTGINFADVREPSFSLDNRRVIQANSVVIHPHLFYAYTAGTVSFNLFNQTANPNLAWSSQLYRDLNCNQDLDVNDIPLTTAINLTANQQICLVVKVISPAETSDNAQYSFRVQSEFIFGNGSLINTAILQNHQDLTIASSDLKGAGNLTLTKSVWNVTRNIAGNKALPNEVLRYTLQYYNNGNGVINEFKLHDTVPEFTSLLGLPQCGTLPNSLSNCQALVNGETLEWQFAGQLQAGASGEVSFEVLVK